ncbi:MAG: hypothetical protein M1826_004417 [Phylliscum demangeonii]|nr:MAG: hypothetical protein M1826_004417 [Phylliscum demangeonii]
MPSSSRGAGGTGSAPANDEEEDYMNMTIHEPARPKEKETYTQRRRRIEREVESKQARSKSELAAAAAAARDAALAQPLHDASPSSKGLKMMQAMGFQPGSVLGKAGADGAGLAEPVRVHVKEDRAGIGLEAARKRQLREDGERLVKRQKADEGDFRERGRLERESKRLEGLVVAAQKVAERLDAEEGVAEEGVGDEDQDEDEVEDERKTQSPAAVKQRPPQPLTRADRTPLKGVNVLWRGLVRHRAETERERRMRYDLHQSLSRFPTYEDDADEEDADVHWGATTTATGLDKKSAILEAELDEDDTDLDAFNALEPAERLQRLLLHLRDRHRYCFWCKYQYPDRAMDDCPGLMEEDHD